MTEPFDLYASQVQVPAKAGVFQRILAFGAGLVVLAGGTIVSVGTVLVAPAGMGIAALIQRHRGRRLSRFGGWIAATGAVVVTMAVIAIVVAALTPAGVWQQARHTADSASVAQAKQPPPAWLERMAPGSSRLAAQQQPMSPAHQTAAIAAGIGFGATFLAVLCGTLGWAAGMLLCFGIGGRWPGSVVTAGSDSPGSPSDDGYAAVDSP
jgi:hypothetical protein